MKFFYNSNNIKKKMVKVNAEGDIYDVIKQLIAGGIAGSMVSLKTLNLYN